MIRMLATLIVLIPLAATLGHAQSAPAKPAAQAAAAKPAAMINLNTATVKELETLPGVGTRTAERIVEYRTKKGPFKKIEELMNVQGIGEKSFLKLKPQLTVSAKPEPATP